MNFHLSAEHEGRVFVLAPSVAHAASAGYKRTARVVIGTIRSNLHLEGLVLRPGDQIIEVGWESEHDALSWMRETMLRNCAKSAGVVCVPAAAAGDPTVVVDEQRWFEAAKTVLADWLSSVRP